jgi:hypothetical protein
MKRSTLNSHFSPWMGIKMMPKLQKFGLKWEFIPTFWERNFQNRSSRTAS